MILISQVKEGQKNQKMTPILHPSKRSVPPHLWIFKNIPVFMGTYHDINQLLDHNRIVITVLLPIPLIEGPFNVSAPDGWTLTIDFNWPKLTMTELNRLFEKEGLEETSPRKQCILEGFAQTETSVDFAKGKVDVELPFEVLSDQRFLETKILRKEANRLFLVITLTKRVGDAPQLKKEVETRDLI